MKKIFTLAFVALGLNFSFAQDIEFHDDMGNIISGQQFVIDSSSSVEYAIGEYYMVNTTGSDLEVTWTRTRVGHMSPFWDQVCDAVICFDATDTYVYSRPESFTIPAGDSSIFQPKLWPESTGGCAIYSYKVYTGLGSYQDSIQVKFRFDGQDCFAGIEDKEDIEFSVYPNPASTTFNVDIKTNDNNAQLRIFNLLGEEVERTYLVNGVNTVSVEGMPNGVYFYSIYQNGNVVETKKLVVRH